MLNGKIQLDPLEKGFERYHKLSSANYFGQEKHLLDAKRSIKVTISHQFFWVYNERGKQHNGK